MRSIQADLEGVIGMDLPKKTETYREKKKLLSCCYVPEENDVYRKNRRIFRKKWKKRREKCIYPVCVAQRHQRSV